jgi:hypothetical protein
MKTVEDDEPLKAVPTRAIDLVVIFRTIQQFSDISAAACSDVSVLNTFLLVKGKVLN